MSIMAALWCRKMLLSSSRGARAALGGGLRQLSVSSARRVDVDPSEEAVFSQDHVEMREVCVCGCVRV